MPRWLLVAGLMIFAGTATLLLNWSTLPEAIPLYQGLFGQSDLLGAKTPLNVLRIPGLNAALLWMMAEFWLTAREQKLVRLQQLLAGAGLLSGLKGLAESLSLFLSNWRAGLTVFLILSVILWLLYELRTRTELMTELKAWQGSANSRARTAIGLWMMLALYPVFLSWLQRI